MSRSPDHGAVVSSALSAATSCTDAGDCAVRGAFCSSKNFRRSGSLYIAKFLAENLAQSGHVTRMHCVAILDHPKPPEVFPMQPCHGAHHVCGV